MVCHIAAMVFHVAVIVFQVAAMVFQVAATVFQVAAMVFQVAAMVCQLAAMVCCCLKTTKTKSSDVQIGGLKSLHAEICLRWSYCFWITVLIMIIIVWQYHLLSQNNQGSCR